MRTDCFSETSGTLLFSLFDSVKHQRTNFHRIHHHSGLELGYICSGQGEYHIGSKTYQVSPGKLYVIRANEQHCMPTVHTPELTFFNIHLTSYYLWHQCPDFIPLEKLHLLIGGPIVHEIEGLSESMEQLQTLSRDPSGSRFLLRRQILRLLEEITDTLDPGIPGQGAISLAHLEDVQAVMLYINEHLAEPLRVEDMIASSHFSRSHMTAVFRYMVGMTPFAYLTLRRVERVIDLLLTTDRPIWSIALDCGFQSQASFNRCFRSATGLSPRDYRKSKR